MTTFTTIPNSDIDQDSPVTVALMTALRDNPLAIAEGDTTADYGLRWTIDDGAGGRTNPIWQGGVDSSAATIEYDGFEAGYEYMFYFRRMLTTSGFAVSLYRDTDAAYCTNVTALTVGNEYFHGYVHVPSPMWSQIFHEVDCTRLGVLGGTFGQSNSLTTRGTLCAFSTSAQTCSKIRFVSSGVFSSASGSDLYMFKRSVIHP